ncbi:MAG: DotA/TraY family protein [Alphaproteobacteria bacterium]|nr:DotA/TraY family protein [Alphaproteobacteria bacterium]
MRVLPMALFDTRKDSGLDQPKRRSVFGSLFNPHLGESLSPIGQSFSLFVRIIAMIFAMNGLFPKDHPALNTDDNAPLSLSYVLRAAWGELSFTREGLPKVLLFSAVSSALALIALSVCIVLMLMFVHPAHAASNGVFTLANPDSDLANNWITFLFDPNNSAAALQNISTTTGQTMPTTSIQSAFVTALATYSDAILIIAAVILFYHLTAMVVETAHHGVPMGKRANQIWAPIRLVVAIGLLVPINGGLNCGQEIVIKVAQLGTALASNVWASFVTKLAGDAGMPPLNANQDISNSVYNVTMMYACEYAYNYQVYQNAEPLGVTMDDNINGWNWSLNGTPTDPTAQTLSSGAVKYSFKNNLVSDYDLCGSYTMPTKPVVSDPDLQQISDTIFTSVQNDFTSTALPAAKTLATQIQVFMDIDTSLTGGVTPSTTIPSPTDLQTAASDFQTQLTATVKNVSSSALQQTINDLTTKSTNEGWVSAGAWFNKLATNQAELNAVIEQSLPSTVAPSGPEKAFQEKLLQFGEKDNLAAAKQSYAETGRVLSEFSSVLVGGKPKAPTNNGATQTPMGGASWSPIGIILRLVDYVASENGIWQQNNNSLNNVGIGVQFTGNNPLLEVAAWGHKCIKAALKYFNYGIYAAAFSGVGGALASVGMALIGATAAAGTGGASLLLILGAGATALLAAAGGVIGATLFFIGALFFGMGVTIAYLVPFLPFMHFFFNTITWIACVAESIVAIPLVALAHLHPEGDGLPGQAKGAYFMIFSVLLRPVLMIFGLIAGLLIMYVGTGLLNALYAAAVAGGGSGAEIGDHLVVSHLVYTVVYVFLLYSIANHAFNLISKIPNHAMEWMGGKSLATEKMGNPSHFEQGVAAVNTYLGLKMGEQVQKLGQGVGGMGQQMVSVRKSYTDADDAQMTTLGKKHALARTDEKDLPYKLRNNKAGLLKYREVKGALDDQQFTALRDYAGENKKEVDDILTDPAHDFAVRNIFGADRATNKNKLSEEYNTWVKPGEKP